MSVIKNEKPSNKTLHYFQGFSFLERKPRNDGIREIVSS